LGEKNAGKENCIDYYPFGLTFNSYQRENATENRYLYNQGTGEKTFKTERTYDLGLNVDQSKYRTYDYITGRWWQIDPKADEGDLSSLTPYNYSFNNPILYGDPEGDCPTCLLGFVIGAAVEYGSQVATNYLNGKSGAEAWKPSSFGDILISGGAGALSGGTSALTGKGTKFAVGTAIDAAESVAKQYNNNGEVSLTQTISDVAGEKLGGAMTKKLDNVVNTSVTTRQLDRAQRVSAGDPSSTGRKATVDKLEKELKIKNNVNQTVSQGSQQVTGDSVQKTSDAVRGGNSTNSVQFTLKPVVQQDATRYQVKLPIKTN
jgi:RHS repeat-associated protein